MREGSLSHRPKLKTVFQNTLYSGSNLYHQVLDGISLVSQLSRESTSTRFLGASMSMNRKSLSSSKYLNPPESFLTTTCSSTRSLMRCGTPRSTSKESTMESSTGCRMLVVFTKPSTSCSSPLCRSSCMTRLTWS